MQYSLGRKSKKPILDLVSLIFLLDIQAKMLEKELILLEKLSKYFKGVTFIS